MLGKRVLTVLWIVPLLVVAAWFSGPEYAFPWFTVLIAVWGILAAWEFYRMVGVSRSRPLAAFGLVWVLLLIIVPHCSYGYAAPILLAAGVALPLVPAVFFARREGFCRDRAWTLGGMLYVGWLMGVLVTLRLEAGREWLFLAVLATWGSDTLAYLVGRAFGRHRMAPRISPGKTWEGAVGGLAGAVIVALLLTLDTPLQIPVGYGQAVLLGALISVFGQLGDLAESLLKRSAGVKESGNLMPGHGGVLDRMDSVVFAGAVVYLYYIFVIA